MNANGFTGDIHLYRDRDIIFPPEVRTTRRDIIILSMFNCKHRNHLVISIYPVNFISDYQALYIHVL